MKRFTRDRLSNIRSITLAGVFAIVTPVLPIGEAAAAELNFTGYAGACSTLNCNAATLNGISFKTGPGDSVSWSSQLFADVGECIRLDVFAQSADMELVLVSPSGAVWKNDDRNASTDFRPLIRARADVKGYYTVQANYFSGNQAVNSLQTFSLAYGRYRIGSFNCPTAYTPVATTSVKAR